MNQRARSAGRASWSAQAQPITAPAAARIRPLLPRTPETCTNPAKASTQGSRAPTMMTAPAATEVNPAAARQPRGHAVTAGPLIVV